MRKIIISVAPVSGTSTDVQPRAVAADVIKCRELGAGMVHLHVRERDGKLTPNLGAFMETAELIRAGTDIVIQASTGGISDMSIEDRCAPLAYELVEMSSLNGGSVNLGERVYINTFDEIRYCAEHCYKHGVIPEIEVFEIGMLNNISLIGEQTPFRKPLLFNIVLGHKGAMPATVEHLLAFRSFIPRDALWGITHFGRGCDYNIISSAVALGASLIRIGFEDSDILAGGIKADYNYQLVEEIVGVIRAMGYEPASPEEVRGMLNIKRRSPAGRNDK